MINRATELKILFPTKVDGHTLNLSRASLSDEDIQYLCEFLKANSRITVLMLDDNNISDDGAITLAEFLETNTTIQTLSLRRNKIGDIGVEAIADALSINTTLTLLNLGDNLFYANAAKYLVDAIRTSNFFITQFSGGTRAYLKQDFTQIHHLYLEVMDRNRKLKADPQLIKQEQARIKAEYQQIEMDLKALQAEARKAEELKAQKSEALKTSQSNAEVLRHFEAEQKRLADEKLKENIKLQEEQQKYEALALSLQSIRDQTEDIKEKSDILSARKREAQNRYEGVEQEYTCILTTTGRIEAQLTRLGKEIDKENVVFEQTKESCRNLENQYKDLHEKRLEHRYKREHLTRLVEERLNRLEMERAAFESTQTQLNTLQTESETLQAETQKAEVEIQKNKSKISSLKEMNASMTKELEGFPDLLEKELELKNKNDQEALFKRLICKVLLNQGKPINLDELIQLRELKNELLGWVLKTLKVKSGRTVLEYALQPGNAIADVFQIAKYHGHGKKNISATFFGVDKNKIFYDKVIEMLDTTDLLPPAILNKKISEQHVQISQDQTNEELNVSRVGL